MLNRQPSFQGSRRDGELTNTSRERDKCSNRRIKVHTINNLVKFFLDTTVIMSDLPFKYSLRDTQFDLRVIVPGESLKVLLNDINQEEQEDNHTIIIV